MGPGKMVRWFVGIVPGSPRSPGGPRVSWCGWLACCQYPCIPWALLRRHPNKQKVPKTKCWVEAKIRLVASVASLWGGRSAASWLVAPWDTAPCSYFGSFWGAGPRQLRTQTPSLCCGASAQAGCHSWRLVLLLLKASCPTTASVWWPSSEAGGGRVRWRHSWRPESLPFLSSACQVLGGRPPSLSCGCLDQCSRSFQD